MRPSTHRDFLNVWACSLMVWLSWNPVVYAGMLWLFSLIVSYAEAKADVVALVRGQNWDFWAVANSTAVWSATWKTTDWQTKEPFFGNMNLGTSHSCWLKSGTLLWMPMGRGGSLPRLTGMKLLISNAETTTARKTCDSSQKLTYLCHNGWDHVTQCVTSPAPGSLAMSDLWTSLRIFSAASPLSILFQVTG